MDFSLPAGNSRRRRRLKKPGAPAPGFTGVWGALSASGARPAPTEPKARPGQPPTSKRLVYTGALLATTYSVYVKRIFIQKNPYSFVESGNSQIGILVVLYKRQLRQGDIPPWK